MSQDYYSALARTIAAIGQDPAQLRMMIYKFVRSELRSELFRRKGIRWTEMKEQTSALERAIDRIETDIASNPELLGISSEQANGGAATSNTALVVHGSSPNSPLETTMRARSCLPSSSSGSRWSRVVNSSLRPRRKSGPRPRPPNQFAPLFGPPFNSWLPWYWAWRSLARCRIATICGG